METTKTLQPGDMGTRLLFKQYGEKLVCVRYRVDRHQRKRYKTVELIIDESPLQPRRPMIQVWVAIGYGEVELRKQVKQAGAQWLPEEKVWEMPYDTAKQLKLAQRIVRRFQETAGQI